jgi:TonB family protein
MTAAVDIALRASLVVLVALTTSVALHRRSAALRHWILAAGILAAATVAPLGRALPSWDFALQRATPIDLGIASLITPATSNGIDPVTTMAARAHVEESAGGMSVASILNTSWALGAAVASLLMVLSLVRLARLTRTATAVADRRWTEATDELRQLLNVGPQVQVLRTNQPGLIGTCGWRRPRVLLPPECDSWSDDRIRIVLGHELAHIRRADWMLQVAAEAVRAVFWYNPLFWMACARLRSESEQAADDAVLEAGVPPPEYAAHLLEIARACRRPLGGGAVVPMARRSTLEGRIAAMLNTTLAHQRPTRRALAAALVVIAGVTVAAASFRGSDQGQPRPLTGTVYDMTGAVLPQVAVTLQNAAGLRQTATTDRFGRFDFGVIAPGRYLLTSTLIGFLPLAQDITLQDARQWDRVITLQVGMLQETVTVIDRRPSGVPPQSTTPAPVGGNIRTPRKTVDIRPGYPEALRAAGIEGVVPIGAVIGADGSVVSVRVLSSRAHPDLTKSAVDAVRQWRFTPTLLNGEAIEVYMTVTVRFSLED